MSHTWQLRRWLAIAPLFGLSVAAGGDEDPGDGPCDGVDNDYDPDTEPHGGARIGEILYDSLEDALAAMVDGDLVEVCEGEHRGSHTVVASGTLLLAGCASKAAVETTSEDPRLQLIASMSEVVGMSIYATQPGGELDSSRDSYGPLDQIEFNANCSPCGLLSKVVVAQAGAQVDPDWLNSAFVGPERSLFDELDEAARSQATELSLGRVINGTVHGRVYSPGVGDWELWLVHQEDSGDRLRSALHAEYSWLDFFDLDLEPLAADGSGRIPTEALLARHAFTVEGAVPTGTITVAPQTLAFHDFAELTVVCEDCTADSWVGLFVQDGLGQGRGQEPSPVGWSAKAGSGTTVLPFANIVTEPADYEFRLYYGSGIGGFITSTPVRLDAFVAGPEPGPSQTQVIVSGQLDELLDEWQHLDDVAALGLEAYDKYISSGMADSVALGVADHMADQLHHNFGWAGVRLSLLRYHWQRGRCSADRLDNLQRTVDDGFFHSEMARHQVPPISGRPLMEPVESIGAARDLGAAVSVQLQELRELTSSCF